MTERRANVRIRRAAALSGGPDGEPAPDTEARGARERRHVQDGLPFMRTAELRGVRRHVMSRRHDRARRPGGPVCCQNFSVIFCGNK